MVSSLIKKNLSSETDIHLLKNISQPENNDYTTKKHIVLASNKLPSPNKQDKYIGQMYTLSNLNNINAVNPVYPLSILR